MSNYIYGITTAEIMSILVCVVLLCYCVFEKKEKAKTRLRPLRAMMKLMETYSGTRKSSLLRTMSSTVKLPKTYLLKKA